MKRLFSFALILIMSATNLAAFADSHETTKQYLQNLDSKSKEELQAKLKEVDQALAALNSAHEDLAQAADDAANKGYGKIWVGTALLTSSAIWVAEDLYNLKNEFKVDAAPQFTRRKYFASQARITLPGGAVLALSSAGLIYWGYKNRMDANPAQVATLIKANNKQLADMNAFRRVLQARYDLVVLTQN